MVNQHPSKVLRIRSAKKDDIPDLVVVENECFQSYYREHRFEDGDFADYLRKEQAILLVATLDSCPVGYVAGTIRSSRSQVSASLDSIAVLPRYREKGVGDRLMQRFIEETKHRECKAVALQVATANEKGILFFSNHGFERIRRLPEYYGEGADAVSMRLEI